MTTTADFIRKMRELCEKVTPGPWGIGSHLRYSINANERHVAMVSCFEQQSGDRAENKANAVFIVSARTALPEALDRLEASEKEIRRAVKALIAEEDVSKIYRTALEQIKNLPVTVFGTAAVLEACEDLHCLIVQIIDKALREAEEGL